MKRLTRDLLLLCALGALTFALSRAGVYAAVALWLDPPAGDGWLSQESAAYLPPEAAPQRTGRFLPPLPEMTENAQPIPTPIPGYRPVPQVRSSLKQPVDYAALLEAGWDFDPSGEGAQILILHTHSCEAYTPEAPGETASADFRSTDPAQSVIAVGDALTEALEGYGFSVLHDRSLYDYPAYNGAYDRSGAAVAERLAQEEGIRVVIDLHRDSLGGARTEYLLPDGTRSAQVMLLLTSGENGLSHPLWRENLKLGLAIQSELEARYPGLARPLCLSAARYNQHLSTGSFLVEVGTEANTLSEAKRAANLLGECLAAVLNGGKGAKS